MAVIFDVPDEIIHILKSKWSDLPRFALESLVLEAYRAEVLTTAEVQQILGYETQYALDGFLKEHGVYLEYTLEELDREAESSHRLRGQRQEELGPEKRKRRAG